MKKQRFSLRYMPQQKAAEWRKCSMLQMIGIDYEKADLDTRSKFAFQSHAAGEAMCYMRDTYELEGMVILSTCNRTEVYSCSVQPVNDLFSIVCSLKGADPEEYRSFVVQRQEEEAVHHLFQLACGMKSKVFGEDQIISQVKTALFQAREVGCTNRELDQLFQMAITAAKKIKSQIHLTAVKTSVIEEMKKALHQELGSLRARHCMVIGNGKIGRMAAEAMVAEGAQVTVTVRNYKTRQVEIPDGCKVVDYSERYRDMGEYDIVISATTSPHHTIKYEDSHHIFEDGRHHILVDLAVPRDISSQYEQVEQVSLYNIDTLGGVAENERDNEAMAQAMQILQEYEEKLKAEADVKESVAAIRTISESCATLTYERAKKQLRQSIKEEALDDVEAILKKAVEKTVSSMLFDLRKSVSAEHFSECIDVLEKNELEKQF